MNKNKLLTFFRTHEAIGAILGVTKQRMFQTETIKKIEHIKVIEKELDIRYNALKLDYRSLKREAKQAYERAKEAKNT